MYLKIERASLQMNILVMKANSSIEYLRAEK